MTSFDLKVDLKSPKLHTIKFLGDSFCVLSLVILPFIGAKIMGRGAKSTPPPFHCVVFTDPFHYAG